MSNIAQQKISNTIEELFHDSRNDKLKMMKGAAKSIFRPMRPTDFEEAYLSISSEQGEHLQNLIIDKGIKNVVEFGTSFGISTLFLAKGILETGGNIITTELLESKAKKAIENFKKANIEHLIEVRIGDAMKTLKGHTKKIDLLLLDGWKDLYLPLFNMLTPNFHSSTLIYVDNANMNDSRLFLETIASTEKFDFTSMFGGTVVLVELKSSPS